MQTRQILLASAIAASLALAGCANDADESAALDTPAADAATADDQDAGLLDEVTAGETIALISAVDQHEIDMAQQARDKDVQGEVLAYADMLFDDHSANLEKGRSVAADAGLEPASTALVGAQQSRGATVMQRLGELEGEEYARAFVDAMVKGHTDALAMLDERLEATDGNGNEAVRAHATASRDAIAAHLEHGKALQAQGLGAGDGADRPASMADDGT